MMAPIEFVILVAKMRAAQKAYYKKPDSRALNTSKCLEKAVDLEIDRQRGQLEFDLTSEQPANQMLY